MALNLAQTNGKTSIPRKRGRPKGSYRVPRPTLDKMSAASVLASFDERALWGRLLASEDDRVVLDAVKFLVVMRDGKPVQQINVNSVNVSVTAEDIAKARAIARTLGVQAQPSGQMEDERSESIMLLGDEGAKKGG